MYTKLQKSATNRMYVMTPSDHMSQEVSYFSGPSTSGADRRNKHHKQVKTKHKTAVQDLLSSSYIWQHAWASKSLTSHSTLVLFSLTKTKTKIVVNVDENWN